MTVDDVGLGFYLLVIPAPEGELHQVPFDSIPDLLSWLVDTWPCYHDWLVGDSAGVIADDCLYVDYVDHRGVQYRDSLIARNETGELVVN